MSDTMTPTAGGPRPKRKIPPVTYAVGAAVLAGAYFLYSRNKAKTAAAASAASGVASSSAPVPAQSYSPGAGDISQLLPYLQNMGGQTSQSGASYVAPTGEGYAGAGLNSGGSSSVMGSNGTTYLPVTSPQAIVNLSKSGTPLFYQPAPGLFMPWTTAPGHGITGAPVFVAQPSSA